MIERHLAPEELLSNSDHSLNIILKGDLQLKLNNNMPSVYLSSTFGEESFFTNQKDDVEYYSKGFCTLINIPRIKFLEVVNSIPDDKVFNFHTKSKNFTGTKI